VSSPSLSASTILCFRGLPRRTDAFTGVTSPSLCRVDAEAAVKGELAAADDGVLSVVEAGEVVVDTFGCVEVGRGAGPGLGLPKKPISVDCFSLT